ncbi:PREDICTED: podocalyxin-like, partial [Buceros rhinoceros silvestris]|uniref:podocalyxin-like n=1 Tax=Buceros rhinoceros silvestris TaxID=175836 RepID=UPI0005284B3B
MLPGTSINIPSSTVLPQASVATPSSTLLPKASIITPSPALPQTPFTLRPTPAITSLQPPRATSPEPALSTLASATTLVPTGLLAATTRQEPSALLLPTERPATIPWGSPGISLVSAPFMALQPTPRDVVRGMVSLASHSPSHHVRERDYVTTWGLSM